MTKHRRSKADKRNTEANQNKSNTNRQATVNPMSDTPNQKPPDLYKTKSSKKDDPPTPSEFLILVADWLRSRKDAPRESSKAADWILAGLTIAIAIAAFWSAFIFQGQLTEAKKQTRLSVRPWVGLDEGPNAIETSSLQIDKDGNASLVYKIVAKNYSSTPAANVWAMANLVVADDLNTVYEQQRYACGDAVIGKPDIGLVLFQGRDRQFTMYPSTTKISVKHENSLIGIWLAGCIGYRDQFGY